MTHMRYVGSKARFRKELLPIILADRDPDQYYVEPFAGGFNLICHVDGPRIGNDIDSDVVACMKAVSDGWDPPTELSEQEYSEIRSDPGAYPQHLVGFVSVGCSYSGKKWGGHARGNGSDGSPRNHCAESRRNVLSQASGLAGVEFSSCDYRDLIIPAKSIVYCDPPYDSTLQYRSGTFDSEAFWVWCDELIQLGHQVFVSEYSAPDHWKCVWQRKVTNSLTADTGAKRGVERLFSCTRG